MKWESSNKERQVRVYPDGHVILKEHRTLSLETPMALQKFPFDKQALKAYLIPFGFNSDEVQLRVNPKYLILVKDYIKTILKLISPSGNLKIINLVWMSQ